MDQKVFRNMVSVEKARRLLEEHFPVHPLSVEEIPLDHVLGRVLAADVEAKIDVPPFDRASMDGYAVQAEDTFGAEEDKPVSLRVVDKIGAGDVPVVAVEKGEAAEISTGAPIPKGANAIVMVEYTWIKEGLKVYRSVAPGDNIMAAGADIMAGEIVLRTGDMLTPRETGVVAAIGQNTLTVYRKPRVAILSTGNELVPPGSPLTYGKIYDINCRTLSDSIVENGGEPKFFGVVGDNRAEIQARMEEALSWADIVLTSGGTSAGVGDLLYRVIDSLGPPGILVHGIAVKPGKPAIIGMAHGKPIFGLPGYPSSSLMIFNVFVRPVLRRMAGLNPEVESQFVEAYAAERIFTSGGRREYMPVNLVQMEGGDYSIYPVPGGSGAITSFAKADGFIEIPEGKVFLESGEKVIVQLLGLGIKPADLMIIGSNCVGINVILSLMRREGFSFSAKVISTGSSGGLVALRRGEADIAGIHLLDEKSGVYNLPFLEKFKIEDKAILVRGYVREQGLVVAKGNPKQIKGIEDLTRSDLSMINRNPGSGTRLLLDMKLAELANAMNVSIDLITRGIEGYNAEAKSHSAVAVSVLQGKADVGLAIRAVAESYGLDFISIAKENYDFLIRRERYQKPAVQAFLEVLRSPELQAELPSKAVGLIPIEDTGKTLYQASLAQS